MSVYDTTTVYQLQSQVAADAHVCGPKAGLEGEWVNSPMVRPAHSRDEAEAQVPEVKLMVPGIAHRQFRVHQVVTKVLVIDYDPIEEDPMGIATSDAEGDERREDEVFEFLDNLRASGAVNMFGAAPYVQEEFEDLDKKEAGWYVGEWMRTFSERHPQ